MNHIIDASGKKIGRVASQVAAILNGKDKTDFRRNTVTESTVTIMNASKIDVTEKKKKTTTFTAYSGYPGGLKTLEMDKIIAKKGMSEILRRAVYGMLPTNKLRSRRIKHLTIKE